MYPKISDFFNDVFGTHWNLPIMSYGFFVAMAFLVGAWILYLELKRKENEGLLKPQIKKVIIGKPASPVELLLNFVIAFLIGYKFGAVLTDYNQFAVNPQEFLISSEGSLLWAFIIGFIVTFYTWYQKHKVRLAKPKVKEVVIHAYDQTLPIVFIAAVFGIIGAKIFDAFENWQTFIADPIGFLVSFSGLTFYGGLIVAAIAVIWYGEKNKLPWKPLADSFAPGLILAYGIGRIGCQVAGDGDWGIVNTMPKPHWLSFIPNWLWSYNYPHNIINEGVPIRGCTGEHCMVLPQGVFPTPVYETLMAIVIFAILWSIRKKIKAPGVLFFIYLIFNGIERFLIEHIRVNNTYDIFGYHITQAELISPILILIGLTGWMWLQKLYKSENKKLQPERK